MTGSVILSAARTPFGKFGGALKDVPAVELGGHAIRAAVERAGIAHEEIDEVIMGMVIQAGAGQVPSRQAARAAGLAWEVPTETINKVCASGLRAVTMADQVIRAGDAQLIVAGGMESMSNAPYALPRARWGMRMGDDAIKDLMVHDGLTCAYDEVHMAVQGSHVAKEYEISREAQDAWALRSHKRAIAAMDGGMSADEITPVPVRGKKGDVIEVRTDEAPRRDTSLEKLAKLPPVYDMEGTITAGNAPGVNDGAGALIVASQEKAVSLGVTPLATILAHVAVGVESARFPTTPGLAINKLLHKTGMRLEEIDLFEVNEAFAAVVLTGEKIVGWDPEKVNVNGGAVALGHPIGASGARILMTLIYELRRRGGGLGIASICSGGGQGDAVLVRVEG